MLPIIHTSARIESGVNVELFSAILEEMLDSHAESRYGVGQLHSKDVEPEE